MVLEKYDFFPESRSIVFTNYARAALEQIIRIENLKDSSIILPAFICRSGLDKLFERYDINPLFVDINLSSYHMDIEKARERMDEAEALLLVHAFGLPANMGRWVKLSSEKETLLIEDCARSIGARWKGKVVGGFGDYSIYSLYKVSPATRGGCLVGNFSEKDLKLFPPRYDEIALGSLTPARIRGVLSSFLKKIRSKISHNNSYAEKKHFKSRYLDKFNEFVFKAYLGDLPRKLEVQRKNALFLKEALEKEGFRFQEDRDNRVYHTAPSIAPCDRDKLVQYLKREGIFTRVIWSQPWSEVWEDESFEKMYPKTCRLSRNIIHFPVKGLNTEELKFIATKTKEFLNKPKLQQ